MKFFIKQDTEETCIRCNGTGKIMREWRPNANLLIASSGLFIALGIGYAVHELFNIDAGYVCMLYYIGLLIYYIVWCHREDIDGGSKS